MDVRIESLLTQRKKRFAARGVTFAMASGVCYGLYTAFLTLAQTQDVWGDWFAGSPWGSGNPALNAFTTIFVLAALAAGLNDLFSGIWSLAVCARNKQLGDLWKTARSKPGIVMMLCAAIGGPFATICYVIALNSATAAGNPGVIVPIAALNCAIGAILGRMLFKQKLDGHTIAGIIVCLIAGGLIGGASFASMGPGALMGCAFALLAAFGWGFEGCVAGFGTALIEYRIGIAIRQMTAGLLELFVVFPALMLVSGDSTGIGDLIGAAASSPSLVIFAVSGLFAMPAYSLWYKGNSMCGAALGMACNGMYAFWGPFFIWVIMGVLGIGGMSASYPPLSIIQWIGALIMVGGIFLIAVDPNPRSAPQRRLKVKTNQKNLPPLYYAIILHFLDGEADSAQGVVEALSPNYSDYRLLTLKDVEEALAIAKENGLLEEHDYTITDSGELRVSYEISEFGKDMVLRYLD